MIQKSSRKKNRIIGAVTLFCFLTTNSVWAVPDGVSILPQNRETPAFLQVEIPKEIASIEEVYEAPPKQEPKLVLHVQNIHGNYEAQNQIKKLLEYLYEKYAFKTIFAEGAVEEVDPEYLRLFKDEDRNKKFADYMAQRGELTGIELYMMGAPKDVRAVGIEEPELYRKNYEAFKKVNSEKEFSGRFLSQYDSRLERLSSLIFSAETRRVLTDWQKFQAGQRDFLPYLRRLSQDARKITGLDLESLFAQVEWPQITRLLVIQTMEEELNVELAQKEKEKVILFLKEKKVSPEIITAIEKLGEKRITMTRENSEAARLEDLPRYLFERLVQEAAPKGFYFHDYPAFSLWAGHLILQSELDSKTLFAEIDRVFEKVLNELTVTESEKNLMELYRDQSLMHKLFAFELTRKEWEKVSYRKEWNHPEAMVSRLTKISGEIGSKKKDADATAFPGQEILGEIPGDSSSKSKIEDLYETALDFYDYARQRETVFMNTMKKEMAASKADKAVLVSGGFHTQGILEMFREDSINYSVLMPRIAQELSTENYLAAMMGSRKTMFDAANLEIPNPAQPASALEKMGVDLKKLRDKTLDAMTKFTSAPDADGVMAVVLDGFNESKWANQPEISVQLIPVSDNSGVGIEDHGKLETRVRKGVTEAAVLPIGEFKEAGVKVSRLSDHVEYKVNPSFDRNRKARRSLKADENKVLPPSSGRSEVRGTEADDSGTAKDSGSKTVSADRETEDALNLRLEAMSSRIIALLDKGYPSKILAEVLEYFEKNPSAFLKPGASEWFWPSAWTSLRALRGILKGQDSDMLTSRAFARYGGRVIGEAGERQDSGKIASYSARVVELSRAFDAAVYQEDLRAADDQALQLYAEITADENFSVNGKSDLLRRIQELRGQGLDRSRAIRKADDESAQRRLTPEIVRVSLAFRNLTPTERKAFLLGLSEAAEQLFQETLTEQTDGRNFEFFAGVIRGVFGNDNLLGDQAFLRGLQNEFIPRSEVRASNDEQRSVSAEVRDALGLFRIVKNAAGQTPAETALLSPDLTSAQLSEFFNDPTLPEWLRWEFGILSDQLELGDIPLDPRLPKLLRAIGTEWANFQNINSGFTQEFRNIWAWVQQILPRLRATPRETLDLDDLTAIVNFMGTVGAVNSGAMTVSEMMPEGQSGNVPSALLPYFEEEVRREMRVWERFDRAYASRARIEFLIRAGIIAAIGLGIAALVYFGITYFYPELISSSAVQDVSNVQARSEVRGQLTALEAKILIVEDEEEMADVVREVLISAGALEENVTIVSKVQEFQRAAVSGQYDIIILDDNLASIGMKGLDALRQMRNGNVQIGKGTNGAVVIYNSDERVRESLDAADFAFGKLARTALIRSVFTQALIMAGNRRSETRVTDLKVHSVRVSDLGTEREPERHLDFVIVDANGNQRMGTLSNEEEGWTLYEYQENDLEAEDPTEKIYSLNDSAELAEALPILEALLNFKPARQEMKLKARVWKTFVDLLPAELAARVNEEVLPVFNADQRTALLSLLVDSVYTDFQRDQPGFFKALKRAKRIDQAGIEISYLDAFVEALEMGFTLTKKERREVVKAVVEKIRGPKKAKAQAPQTGPDLAAFRVARLERTMAEGLEDGSRMVHVRADLENGQAVMLSFESGGSLFVSFADGKRFTAPIGSTLFIALAEIITRDTDANKAVTDEMAAFSGNWKPFYDWFPEPWQNALDNPRRSELRTVTDTGKDLLAAARKAKREGKAFSDPDVKSVLARVLAASSIHDKGLVENKFKEFYAEMSTSNLVRFLLSINLTQDYEKFVSDYLVSVAANDRDEEETVLTTLESILDRGFTYQRFYDVQNAANIFSLIFSVLGRIGSKEAKDALSRAAKDSFFALGSASDAETAMQEFFGKKIEGFLLPYIDFARQGRTQTYPNIAALAFLSPEERRILEQVSDALKKFNTSPSDANLQILIELGSRADLYLREYGYVLSFSSGGKDFGSNLLGVVLGPIIKKDTHSSSRGGDANVIHVKNLVPLPKVLIAGSVRSREGFQMGFRNPIVVHQQESVRTLQGRVSKTLNRSAASKQGPAFEELELMGYHDAVYSEEGIEERFYAGVAAHEFRHFKNKDDSVIQVPMLNLPAGLINNVVAPLASQTGMAPGERNKFSISIAEEISAFLAEMALSDESLGALAELFKRAGEIAGRISSTGIGRAKPDEYEAAALAIISAFLQYMDTLHSEEAVSEYKINVYDFTTAEAQLDKAAARVVRDLKTGFITPKDIGDFAEGFFGRQFSGKTLYVSGYEKQNVRPKVDLALRYNASILTAGFRSLSSFRPDSASIASVRAGIQNLDAMTAAGRVVYFENYTGPLTSGQIVSIGQRRILVVDINEEQDTLSFVELPAADSVEIKSYLKGTSLSAFKRQNLSLAVFNPRSEIRLAPARSEVRHPLESAMLRNELVGYHISGPVPQGLNPTQVLNLLLENYTLPPYDREFIFKEVREKIGNAVGQILFPDAPPGGVTWSIAPRAKAGFFATIYFYTFTYKKESQTVAVNIASGFGRASEVVRSDVFNQNYFSEMGRSAHHPGVVTSGPVSLRHTTDALINPLLLGRYTTRFGEFNPAVLDAVARFLGASAHTKTVREQTGTINTGLINAIPGATEIHFSVQASGTLPVRWEVGTDGSKKFTNFANPHETAAKMIAALVYYSELQEDQKTVRALAEVFPNAGDWVVSKDAAGAEKISIITMRARKTMPIPAFIDGLIHLFALDENKKADELVNQQQARAVMALPLPISNPAIAFHGLLIGNTELYGDVKGVEITRMMLEQYAASPLSEPYRKSIEDFLAGKLPVNTDFSARGFVPSRAEVRAYDWGSQPEPVRNFHANYLGFLDFLDKTTLDSSMVLGWKELRAQMTPESARAVYQEYVLSASQENYRTAEPVSVIMGDKTFPDLANNILFPQTYIADFPADLLASEFPNAEIHGKAALALHYLRELPVNELTALFAGRSEVRTLGVPQGSPLTAREEQLYTDLIAVSPALSQVIGSIVLDPVRTHENQITGYFLDLKGNRLQRKGRDVSFRIEQDPADPTTIFTFRSDGIPGLSSELVRVMLVMLVKAGYRQVQIRGLIPDNQAGPGERGSVGFWQQYIDKWSKDGSPRFFVPTGIGENFYLPLARLDLSKMAKLEAPETRSEARVKMYDFLALLRDNKIQRNFTTRQIADLGFERASSWVNQALERGYIQRNGLDPDNPRYAGVYSITPAGNSFYRRQKTIRETQAAAAPEADTSIVPETAPAKRDKKAEGARLRELRGLMQSAESKKRVTQYELADRLTVLLGRNVSQLMVASWESGLVLIPADVFSTVEGEIAKKSEVRAEFQADERLGNLADERVLVADSDLFMVMKIALELRRNPANDAFVLSGGEPSEELRRTVSTMSLDRSFQAVQSSGLKKVSLGQRQLLINYIASAVPRIAELIQDIRGPGVGAAFATKINNWEKGREGFRGLSEAFLQFEGVLLPQFITNLPTGLSYALRHELLHDAFSSDTEAFTEPYRTLLRDADSKQILQELFKNSGYARDLEIDLRNAEDPSAKFKLSDEVFVQIFYPSSYLRANPALQRLRDQIRLLEKENVPGFQRVTRLILDTINVQTERIETLKARISEMYPDSLAAAAYTPVGENAAAGTVNWDQAADLLRGPVEARAGETLLEIQGGEFPVVDGLLAGRFEAQMDRLLAQAMRLGLLPGRPVFILNEESLETENVILTIVQPGEGARLEVRALDLSAILPQTRSAQFPISPEAIALAEPFIARSDFAQPLGNLPGDMEQAKRVMELLANDAPMAEFWNAPARSSLPAIGMMRTVSDALSAGAMSDQDWKNFITLARTAVNLYAKVAFQENLITTQTEIVQKVRRGSEIMRENEFSDIFGADAQVLLALYAADVAVFGSGANEVNQLSLAADLAAENVLPENALTELIRLTSRFLSGSNAQKPDKFYEFVFNNYPALQAKTAEDRARMIKKLVELHYKIERERFLKERLLLNVLRYLQRLGGGSFMLKDLQFHRDLVARGWISPKLAALFQSMHQDFERRGIPSQSLRYDFSGGDLITPLLMTDALELNFSDALPFGFDADPSASADLKETYRIEKLGAGYSSNVLIDLIGNAKTIILWELEGLGATDIRIEQEPGNPQAVTVLFKWSYTGNPADAKERTLRYTQSEITVPANTPLPYTVEGNYYLRKAGHSFGLPALKTNVVISYNPNETIRGYKSQSVKTLPGYPGDNFGVVGVAGYSEPGNITIWNKVVRPKIDQNKARNAVLNTVLRKPGMANAFRGKTKDADIQKFITAVVAAWNGDEDFLFTSSNLRRLMGDAGADTRVFRDRVIEESAVFLNDTFNRSEVRATRRDFLTASLMGAAAFLLAPSEEIAAQEVKLSPEMTGLAANIQKGLESYRNAKNGLLYNQMVPTRSSDIAWIKSGDVGFSLSTLAVRYFNSKDAAVKTAALNMMILALKTHANLVRDFGLKIAKDGTAGYGPKFDGEATGILPEILGRDKDYFKIQPDKEGQVAYASFDMALTHERLIYLQGILKAELKIVAGKNAAREKLLNEVLKSLDGVLSAVSYRAFVDGDEKLHHNVLVNTKEAKVPVLSKDLVDNKHTEAIAFLSLIAKGYLGKAEKLDGRIAEGEKIWDAMKFEWELVSVSDKEKLPVGVGDPDRTTWAEYYAHLFYDIQTLAPKTLGVSGQNYFKAAAYAAKVNKHKTVGSAPGTGKDSDTYKPFGLLNADLADYSAVPYGIFMMSLSGEEGAKNLQSFLALVKSSSGYSSQFGLVDAYNPKTVRTHNGKVIFMNQALILEVLFRKMLRADDDVTAFIEKKIKEIETKHAIPEKLLPAPAAEDSSVLEPLIKEKKTGVVSKDAGEKYVKGNTAVIDETGKKIELKYLVDGTNTFGGAWFALPEITIEAGHRVLEVTIAEGGKVPASFKVEFKDDKKALVGAAAQTSGEIKAGQTIKIDITDIAIAAKGKKISEIVFIFDKEGEGSFTVSGIKLKSRSEARQFTEALTDWGKLSTKISRFSGMPRGVEKSREQGVLRDEVALFEQKYEEERRESDLRSSRAAAELEAAYWAYVNANEPSTGLILVEKNPMILSKTDIERLWEMTVARDKAYFELQHIRANLDEVKRKFPATYTNIQRRAAEIGSVEKYKTLRKDQKRAGDGSAIYLLRLPGLEQQAGNFVPVDDAQARILVARILEARKLFDAESAEKKLWDGLAGEIEKQTGVLRADLEEDERFLPPSQIAGVTYESVGFIQPADSRKYQSNIAVSSDGKIAVWNAREIRSFDSEFKEKEKFPLEGFRSGIAVDSRDFQTRVAVQRDEESISVFNLDKPSEGIRINTGRMHYNSRAPIAFSPDGSEIAVISAADTLKIFDSKTGALKQTFKLNGFHHSTIAWNSDKSRIVLVNDSAVTVIDSVSGAVLATINPKNVFPIPGNFAGAAFSPDGKNVLTLDDGGNLDLWNGSTGERIFSRYVNFPQRVASVAILPDVSKVAFLRIDGNVETIKIDWERTAEDDGDVFDLTRSEARVSPDVLGLKGWGESARDIVQTQRGAPTRLGVGDEMIINDVLPLLGQAVAEKQGGDPSKQVPLMAVGIGPAHLERAVRGQFTDAAVNPILGVDPSLDAGTVRQITSSVPGLTILTKRIEDLTAADLGQPVPIVYGSFFLEYTNIDATLEQFKTLSAGGANFVLALHFKNSSEAEYRRELIAKNKLYLDFLQDTKALVEKRMMAPAYKAKWDARMNAFNKPVQRNAKDTYVMALGSAADRKIIASQIASDVKRAGNAYVASLTQFAPFVTDSAIQIPQGILSATDEEALRKRFNRVFESEAEAKAYFQARGFENVEVTLRQLEGQGLYFIASFASPARSEVRLAAPGEKTLAGKAAFTQEGENTVYLAVDWLARLKGAEEKLRTPGVLVAVLAGLLLLPDVAYATDNTPIGEAVTNLGVIAANLSMPEVVQRINDLTAQNGVLKVGDRPSAIMGVTFERPSDLEGIALNNLLNPSAYTSLLYVVPETVSRSEVRKIQQELDLETAKIQKWKSASGAVGTRFRVTAVHPTLVSNAVSQAARQLYANMKKYAESKEVKGKAWNDLKGMSMDKFMEKYFTQLFMGSSVRMAVSDFSHPSAKRVLALEYESGAKDVSQLEISAVNVTFKLTGGEELSLETAGLLDKNDNFDVTKLRAYWNSLFARALDALRKIQQSA